MHCALPWAGVRRGAVRERMTQLKGKPCDLILRRASVCRTRDLRKVWGSILEVGTRSSLFTIPLLLGEE